MAATRETWIVPIPVMFPAGAALLITTEAPGEKMAPELTVMVPATLKFVLAATVAEMLEIVRFEKGVAELPLMVCAVEGHCPTGIEGSRVGPVAFDIHAAGGVEDATGVDGERAINVPGKGTAGWVNIPAAGCAHGKVVEGLAGYRAPDAGVNA